MNGERFFRRLDEAVEAVAVCVETFAKRHEEIGRRADAASCPGGALHEGNGHFERDAAVVGGFASDGVKEGGSARDEELY